MGRAAHAIVELVKGGRSYAAAGPIYAVQIVESRGTDSVGRSRYIAAVEGCGAYLVRCVGSAVGTIGEGCRTYDIAVAGRVCGCRKNKQQ